MAVSAQAPLTIEEFSRLPDEGERHELSAGEVTARPAAKVGESLIRSKLLEFLSAALKHGQSSEAFVAAGYLLSRHPLTIRQADVSLLSKERIQSTRVDEYFAGAPELAVEIVSSSDSAEYVQIKVDQYLAAGAKQVWVVYPKSKDVHVFYSLRTFVVFNATQTLTGADLLPGFSMKVADLFHTEGRSDA